MNLKASAAVVALTIAGGAVAGVAAPLAHARGADGVISSLEAEGYTVRINWLTGQRTSLLPRCTVVRVNNPSSSEPKPGDVVWVDVTCPTTSN